MKKEFSVSIKKKIEKFNKTISTIPSCKSTSFRALIFAHPIDRTIAPANVRNFNNAKQMHTFLFAFMFAFSFSYYLIQLNFL